MMPDTAIEFLLKMGCNKVRRAGKEVMCSCPFPENHTRGDRRPSFSARVDVAADEWSPFFCFSCNARGTLEALAISKGYEEFVLERKVRRDDRPWMYKGKQRTGSHGHLCKKNEKPVLFKDEYLAPFVGVLCGYLKQRGVLLGTAKEWELGLDRYNDRATFTVRNADGHLAMVIGRDITGRSKIKYSNYVLDRQHGRMVPFITRKREEDFISPTKSFYLYGEHKAYQVYQGHSDREKSDLIVVEGPLDVLNVWQMGYNVVAILGSFPSDMQVGKLISLVPRGKRLIIMPDGDKAGRRIVGELAQKVAGRMPIFEARLGEGCDPGGSSEKDISDALNKIKPISLTSAN